MWGLISARWNPFAPAPPTNLTKWHEWFVVLPRMTTEGTLVINGVYRRWNVGTNTWEYRNKPETYQEWLDRQSW